MRTISTIAQAYRCLAINYPIMPELFRDDLVGRVGAFNHALGRIEDMNAKGHPVVISAGDHVLLVAVPGESLKLVDGAGHLYRAAEQDFQVLIRDRWAEVVA